MTEIERLIATCRAMAEDHHPDGWPAVQMKTITALCDEVERLTPAFEIGEAVTGHTFEGDFDGVISAWTKHRDMGFRYGVHSEGMVGKTGIWLAEDQISRRAKEVKS